MITKTYPVGTLPAYKYVVVLSEYQGKILLSRHKKRTTWETQGGKIEPGETPEEALAREIKEELETVIEVGELIHTVEYDYPTFHLSMDCFWCEIIKGNLVLKEAEDARWLTKDQLYDVKWLPADITLIGIIEKCL